MYVRGCVCICGCVCARVCGAQLWLLVSVCGANVCVIIWECINNYASFTFISFGNDISRLHML